MTMQRVLAAVLLIAVVLLVIDAALQRSVHSVLAALIGAGLAAAIFVSFSRRRRAGP